MEYDGKKSVFFLSSSTLITINHIVKNAFFPYYFRQLEREKKIEIKPARYCEIFLNTANYVIKKMHFFHIMPVCVYIHNEM